MNLHIAKAETTFDAGFKRRTARKMIYSAPEGKCHGCRQTLDDCFCMGPGFGPVGLGCGSEFDGRLEVERLKERPGADASPQSSDPKDYPQRSQLEGRRETIQ